MSYEPTIDDEKVLSDIQTDTDTDDDSDTSLTQSVPKKISSRAASSSSSSSSRSANNICKVCLMNDINIALSPCGDVKICESCWLSIVSDHSERVVNNDNELKPKCPCCKQGVETYIKIYFS